MGDKLRSSQIESEQRQYAVQKEFKDDLKAAQKESEQRQDATQNESERRQDATQKEFKMTSRQATLNSLRAST